MESDLLPFAHLNLTVADLDRSLDFYRRWFGFDGSPTTYSDGTVFVRNRQGFDLALHPGPPAEPPPRSFHFGFRPHDPEQVRRLHEALTSAGVPLIEHLDEPEYVGFKCLDPDGYEIEVYWEPAPSDGAT